MATNVKELLNEVNLLDQNPEVLVLLDSRYRRQISL